MEILSPRSLYHNAQCHSQKNVFLTLRLRVIVLPRLNEPPRPAAGSPPRLQAEAQQPRPAPRFLEMVLQAIWGVEPSVAQVQRKTFFKKWHSTIFSPINESYF